MKMWGGGGGQIKGRCPNIYVGDNIITDSNFVGITSREMELLTESCDDQPENRPGLSSAASLICPPVEQKVSLRYSHTVLLAVNYEVNPRCPRIEEGISLTHPTEQEESHLFLQMPLMHHLFLLPPPSSHLSSFLDSPFPFP